MPIILYTGGVGLTGILDMHALTGIQSETTLMWVMGVIIIIIIVGYFVLPMVPSLDIVKAVGQYHSLGIVFVLLSGVMVLSGILYPREKKRVQVYTGDVDITQWKWAPPCGIGLPWLSSRPTGILLILVSSGFS